MEATDTLYGIAIPSELVLPVKTGAFTGKAGTLYLSSGKLHFIPTDGGAAEVVTSA